MPTKKTTKKKSSNKKPAKKPAKKAATNSAKKSLVGARVPDLALPVTGGATVALRDLMGKKVVLYFYPKDMTPGCTIEGHEFSKLKPQFEAAGAVVYGISRDSISSHEKFKSKECYTVELLSDEDEKLCKAFHVIKMKNMYGKKVRGIERSTFVVDDAGQIVKEWRGVKVEGHADEVLQFLGTL